ncbi:MAG: chemotaxis protein CheW [Rhodospirillaceae bacterium]
MPPTNVTKAGLGEGAALRVLTLGLGGEIFAIETERVHEVLDLIPITRVPNSRPFIKGLINVRGKVVTVTDLRVKFGMPPVQRSADSRIVVIEVQVMGETTLVGALTDQVFEATELPAASMEEAPKLGMSWRTEFIRAIGKRGDDFIIIADIDQVFAAADPVH